MKKIILLLTATVALFSCSKVGKDEYIISGTAKGVENGKTIIMETQDPKGMGLIAVDTVKVQNGKFEIKGKITETSFHLLQLESANGKVPFILESGEISVVIDKDSITKSKVSGTYSNDEFVKFNEDMIKINKELTDFKNKNMPVFQMAQQNKDTAAMNRLNNEYAKINQTVGTKSKEKYSSYAESHPKSFISVLIIQGMQNSPDGNVQKIEKLYNSLDESLKNSKPGKDIKAKLGQANNPSVGTTPPPPPPAPASSTK